MMKQINISKERVLQLMHNFLEDGCYIPFTTIGNGSAGLQCLLSVDDIQEFPNFDMTGLIADSDLSPDFDSIATDNYDICVEFFDKERNTKYQVLLWLNE